MDIARDICTDSFYIVNSGLPCIAVTAVLSNVKILYIKLFQFIFLTFFHIQRIFFHILNILHIFFTLYSFFLWITHFFINSIIHSIMRCKYSFKEFIHSIVRQNIHSKILFIQKIIWLFIQWKYSFLWKMTYRPPLYSTDHFSGILATSRWWRALF